MPFDGSPGEINTLPVKCLHKKQENFKHKGHEGHKGKIFCLLGLSLAPLVLHVTLPKDIVPMSFGRMTSESPVCITSCPLCLNIFWLVRVKFEAVNKNRRQAMLN